MTMRAETTAVLSKAGMLCQDGRCKTLDAAADGYTRGEACVVHLLEAATAEELAAGIAAEAVLVLGTAVNQDGRSSSLTAPNGPSQQQVCCPRQMLLWLCWCARLVPSTGAVVLPEVGRSGMAAERRSWQRLLPPDR